MSRMDYSQPAEDGKGLSSQGWRPRGCTTCCEIDLVRQFPQPNHIFASQLTTPILGCCRSCRMHSNAVQYCRMGQWPVLGRRSINAGCIASGCEVDPSAREPC